MLSSSAVLLVSIAFAYAAPNSGSVCSQNPYKALAPLSAYPPAQSYCSKNYPVAASTTTVTITESACISTATPPPTRRDASELQERDLSALKKALASMLVNKKSIIATACSCIETTKTVTATATTSLALASPLPSCCNNAPFAEIRQQGSDLFGVCAGCTYSDADGRYSFEAYPYNTNCDFRQYCIQRCEAQGSQCKGVTKQIPTSNAYPNCQFLYNAVGGGAVSSDSDTLYKLPANVPLCNGTQVQPAQCACGGGGPCIPV
ncbi:hypothetical protein HII31_12237 [Pseudocercospora fuligena]|uniref:Apple domain-containing protein n=1 Tax=Pseudocercospora fuligena TaxID=685502 RepID=A0A8H6RAE7_9PEZI|nr:hypothetical protein HII31_12237 [Pseudocercospora fuligena]